MRNSSSTSIWQVEIIPVEQKSKIEMHLTGRNNPCGTKELDRDVSGWGEIIPVAQKSKIEMLISFKVAVEN